MTAQEIKILCLTQSAQLPALIKSVFSVVPHQIEVVTALDKLYTTQQEQAFDLFVLDNENAREIEKTVQKIRLTNPRMPLIIIEKNYDNMEDLVNIPDIFFISRQEMLAKLPLILGEVYSGIKQRKSNSFANFSLLKSGFDALKIFVAMINENGQFVFLNKAAQDLLNIAEVDYPTLFINEVVEEGTAVWKYLQEQCLKEKKSSVERQINFRDAQNQTFSLEIAIEPIVMDKTYILLQEMGMKADTEAYCVDKEYEILNKFADSIANELLNPVNVFSGRLQMLSSLGPAEDESFNKNIAVLNKQVERINELMEKLLTFARLKQDAFPQKININELLNRVLLAPGIEKWQQNGDFTLELDLCSEPPIVRGLLVQLDMLIKLILDRSFDCLGNEGKINIKTALGNGGVIVGIELHYNRSIFGDDSILNSYFSKETGKYYNTIEAVIIRHLLHRYGGSYRFKQKNQNTEALELFIPS